MNKITVNKLPDSQVEIIAEVPAEEFSKYRPMAVAKLGQSVTIPGFRPGKAPEKVLVDQIGESKILEEMADMAVRDWYPKLVTENKIDAIGHPEIVITKMALGNPFEFKAKTAVYPEIKLPDYKKIAKDIVKNSDPAKEIADADVDKAISEMEKTLSPQDGEVEKFDDEKVKQLGDYKDLADFKAKLKEKMTEDEKRKATEKSRLKIIEKIGEEAKPEIPEVLIRSEIDKMFAEMESQISRNGLKVEDYLKHLNTTVEKLADDWRPQATSRVRFGLIMEALKEAEKIKPEEKLVAEEMEKIKKIYPNLPDSHLRPHIEQMLINEEIFVRLEK